MTDERQGFPSASSAERYALCPGSLFLEKECPPEPETPDASSGNRIHAALAGETVFLSPDELQVFEACKRQEEALVSGINSWRCIGREKRLWFNGNGNGAQDWSGKPDAVYGAVGENVGLVIDYKTGRG